MKNMEKDFYDILNTTLEAYQSELTPNVYAYVSLYALLVHLGSFHQSVKILDNEIENIFFK
jgi:hypothetical protein